MSPAELIVNSVFTKEHMSTGTYKGPHLTNRNHLLMIAQSLLGLNLQGEVESTNPFDRFPRV